MCVRSEVFTHLILLLFLTSLNVAECSNCGFKADRDLNTAINLKLTLGNTSKYDNK